MASKTPNRAVARKLKDKWKAKEWYRILAPDMYERTPVSETLADDPEKVIGRILEISLQDLTGDFTKMHIKLHFRVTEVAGTDAHTTFIGHGLASDYLRRLTRRKRSKTAGVYDVMTKEGYKVRVKPLAITEKRIQTSQQRQIREIMGKVIEKVASEKTLTFFVKDMTTGALSDTMVKECKAIYPLKKVEVAKSEILVFPSADKISAALAEEMAIKEAMAKAEEAGKDPEEAAAEAATTEEEAPKKKVKKVKVAKVSDDVKALTELNGVGPSKAKLLFEAGYTTVAKVKKAKEADLAEVVGPALAKKILS